MDLLLTKQRCKIVRDNIVRETRLHTDKLHFGMDKDYSRETVRHSGKERIAISRNRLSLQRIALGVDDGERAAIAIVGASGKRLTYRGLTKPDYSFTAKRFIRWRKKRWKAPRKKPKRPKFVRYWRSRKPVP